MSGSGKPRYNNTAGRLFDLLEHSRRHPDGDQTLFAWAAVFRLSDKNDSVAVYRYLGEMNSALNAVERDVKELLPDEAVELLQDFPAIRQATAPLNLSTGWGQYKQHLGEHAMRSLQFCAVRLPKDASVSLDEIKEIQDAVSTLFEQVRTSGIKNPLKTWLLDRLAAIKQMIDLYWIKGPNVVREALVALAGEATAYGQKFEEVNKEAPDVFARLVELLNKLASVAEQVDKLQPLLEYAGAFGDFVVKMITGPG